MDLRYAFLIFWGVIGVVAWFYGGEGYREAWLVIAAVAWVWAAVVWFRNRHRKPGKHFPRKRNRR